jgi:hypothetical protein
VNILAARRKEFALARALSRASEASFGFARDRHYKKLTIDPSSPFALIDCFNRQRNQGKGSAMYAMKRPKLRQTNAL